MNAGRGALARGILAASSLVASLAAPGAAIDAVFLQRLSLPVAGDDIGYGHCVTADARTGESFVCDPRTNRILIFDRDGFFDAEILGGVDIFAPDDLAVDPEGRIVVLAQRSGGKQPVELDFDGRFRRDVPLVGLPRDAGPPNLASLALSPDGSRLYVADAANLKLWIADRSGLVMTGVDLAGDLEPDERRNFTIGHVDAYGDRVVLALPMLGRIRVFTLDGEPAGFVGIHGAAPCQLGYPTAAAIDKDGIVLALDQQRMKVSRWRLTDNRCLGEYIGLGNAPGALYFPYDMALDPSGRLFIAQSADGRVQVFRGLGEAPPVPH